MDECSDFASLERPACPRFCLQPLQRAPSLSHARSLTQQPTRSSAYTVPGRARGSHPHSLKRARPSPTPAPCSTQPSMPIIPEFYHVLHRHVQKHPRMWHSSAAPTYATVDAFCFPRSKSRQCRRIREFRDTTPEKSRICHIRAPFYTKVLLGWCPTMLAQATPFLTRCVQQRVTQTTPFECALSNTLAQTSTSCFAMPYTLAQTNPSRFATAYTLTQFCWDGIRYACTTSPVQRIPPITEKPPHKREAAFYKTMRSFNRAWVQPSQAFDQERARREIYSAASSVAGFSALGAAAFFLG